MATTKTGYTVVALEDVEQGELREGRVRHKVRDQFGIEGFGVNAFRAVEPGAQVINEHAETGVASPGQQELYVVVSGRARFTVDGEEVDAPAGTLVYVEPGVKRAAVADEEGTTVLVVGGAPGIAYNQSPGYRVGPMFEPYNNGDYAAAAEICRGVLADTPGEPLALFNLACMESLLGETDDALEHLGEAIGTEPGCVDLAKTDDDFKTIRDDPRFKELVG
jgi:quercetin dioxygenase-like cupin family protein